MDELTAEDRLILAKMPDEIQDAVRKGLTSLEWLESIPDEEVTQNDGARALAVVMESLRAIIQEGKR